MSRFSSRASAAFVCNDIYLVKVFAVDGSGSTAPYEEFLAQRRSIMAFWRRFFGRKTTTEEKADWVSSKAEPEKSAVTQREKKAKLRCQVCGHIQRRGDWEKAMDAQAKAMGARGFIGLGAEPQCLKCGSRELRDISRPVSAEEEEPQFITDAAEEIVHIMEPYFTTDRGVLEKEAGKHLVAIGKSLYDKGGHAAMLAAFKKVRDLAHRRFGYTGSNRSLEMFWDGIGEWRG